MRLDSPRIRPVGSDRWNEEQKKLLEPMVSNGKLLNIYGTLGVKPKAARAFLAWGHYVLRESSLPATDREIAILRVGELANAGYELWQHSRVGRAVGLSDHDIEAAKAGPDHPLWDVKRRTLLTAVDELFGDHFISDSSWQALGVVYSQEECMDLVYVVGHYTQVCMILNTFGVQIEKE
ncbi:carboxymuconolactone decarboxylase family protein [Hyphomonas oceanitis]|uniref:Carboxymuconolactone decarboxylase n=1 Tax=Hyphomonas oceanitis SCH89 TaxID=1280953 RepID=A0A059G5X8_9PROT|nr:carboxymuconolactone decarboxylase family protein [Hyphomonas oceanitis]KDA01858.1 carboxymuconolactone decarboxylase [Hyphomonas oceanitis SCH89]